MKDSAKGEGLRVSTETKHDIAHVEVKEQHDVLNLNGTPTTPFKGSQARYCYHITEGG